MKTQMALVCHKVGQFTIQNGPTILTISASVGVVTTALTSARAGMKCARVLEELEYSSEKKPTKKEKAKKIAPHAITPVLCGAATIACIIGAHKMHIHREAAIAAAYTILDNRYKKYRDEVISEIGEKKENRLKDQAAQKAVNETYENGLNVIRTGYGDILFMDNFSGRYFYSSYEHIERAKLKISELAMNNMSVSVNELYDALEIPPVGGGEFMGWNIMQVNDEGLGNVIPIVANRTCLTPTPEKLPCTVIDYDLEPIVDFNRCF